MRQEHNGTAVGNAANANARSSGDAARGAGMWHTSGGLNLNGVPCEVVSPPPSDRRVASGPYAAHLEVRPDGSVSSATRPAELAARSIVRRPAIARGQAAMVPGPNAGSMDFGTRELAAAARAGNGGSAGAGGGDLQKIHRVLRGRYWIASLLAACLGAAGAYAGMRLGYKTYQSTGLITIVPVRNVLQQAGGVDNTLDQFMEAQAAKLHAQHVMDVALDDPSWQSLGRGRSDEIEAAFAKELEVTRQGQMLLVKFTDRDPMAAQVAVQTTMNAFRKLFDAEQAQSGVLAQEQGATARTELSAKLTRIQQQIDDNAGIYGPEGLESQRAFLLMELREVQKNIHETDRSLAEQPAAAAALAMAMPTTRPSADIPLEEIARVDQLTGDLLRRRAMVDEEIQTLRAGGMGDRMPKLAALKAQYDVLTHELADRADEWRAMRDRGFLTPAGTPATLSEENRQAKLKYLKGRQDAILADLKQVTGWIGAVERLRIEKERVQRDLNIAEETLQQYEVEKTNWRVEVGTADRPLTSFRDTRVTFAGAGGLGGTLFGFGTVLLLGLMNPRVRDPKDAAGGAMTGPVLGMLPQLPDDLSDPAQAAVAAHGVHGVRALLQIWGNGHGHRVFGITSSAAGTGKTSLTIALGASYATAHLKTLVIDCDLVGAGLTARTTELARRRDAGSTKVEAAGADQAAGRQRGLLDVLAGARLEDCIVATQIPGMFVLPTGAATAQHAGTLSPEALQRVIRAARERFEVVLVDTGPVPGSLEASMVASQVDAVVMTVARGDRRPDIDRSIAHLRSLGTCIAGMVFNRARPRDIDVYTSSRASSSLNSVGEGGEGGASVGTTPIDAGRAAAFGPVACAVASFAPAAGRAAR